MKKKQRIGLVEITDTKVTAYDTDGTDVKLTRHQRDIFKNYKRGLLENVTKEFGTEYTYILSESFFIKKNGNVVFQM